MEFEKPFKGHLASDSDPINSLPEKEAIVYRIQLILQQRYPS